jgi:hypothetical protein
VSRKRSTKAVINNKVYGSNGVFYRFPQGEGVGQPIEIRVDFGQVAEPQNYYFADSFLFSLDEVQRMATLSFGRRDLAGEKFADRIDIVMPTKSILGAFWQSIQQAGVDGTVDKALAAAGLVPRVASLAAPSDLAQTFFANMIFVAAGDGESTLDFYHLSPRTTHLAKTQKTDMALAAAVRIIISSVLTKYFFDVIRSHADKNFESRPVQEGGKRAAQ